LCGLGHRGRLRPSSPVSPMVGALAVTASAARITVRDDLPIAAGAVATMGGSTGCCPSTVGVGREFPSSAVATCARTVACGFVVLLAVPDGGHLSDPVVDSHEVGVLRELCDDFSRAHPLSLTCYRSDRHEALLWGSVHPTLDLVECFRKVPDGKGLAETSAPFVPLSVVFTSSVPIGVGFVSGRVGGQLVR
jgi:hypothetical protein